MILPIGLGIGRDHHLNRRSCGRRCSRVFDKSFRYTVDKTSREILFLPLPADIKLKAKPFVDVTVDRLASGEGALILLVLIKPWGLEPRMAADQLRQPRRDGGVDRPGAPGEARLHGRRSGAASSSRTCSRGICARHGRPVHDRNARGGAVHPDPRHVLLRDRPARALDKRHLISPLLLHHESPEVRARALRTLEAAASRRAGAVVGGHRADAQGRATPRCGRPRLRALAAIARRTGRRGHAPVPRGSGPADGGDRRGRAGATVPPRRTRAAAKTRCGRWRSTHGRRRSPSGARSRRRSGRSQSPTFRHLLVPLMYDPSREVAEEAIRSAGRLGAADYLFVTPLLSLLRNRLLKARTRGRCWSAMAKESSRRSPTSCATKRKTSGCGGTCRRRSR